MYIKLLVKYGLKIAGTLYMIIYLPSYNATHNFPITSQFQSEDQIVSTNILNRRIVCRNLRT